MRKLAIVAVGLAVLGSVALGQTLGIHLQGAVVGPITLGGFW